MNGAERIARERQRQIDVEGWGAAHDARGTPGDLNMAAVCYVIQAGSSDEVRDALRHVKPSYWPWAFAWWKPGGDNSNASRIRELEKAGALLAAEIDRLLALDKPENIA